MACPTTVNETVCVQCQVTITPQIDVGEILSFCAGTPVIGPCSGTPQEFCSFVVSQSICVQVPLTFHANATAQPAGLVCGTPGIGQCGTTATCTNTVGFYRNNTDVTNTIITNAGGSIILGVNSTGLSFTVTTANANAVLTFNTPSPPAPDSPPFEGQYQSLYAQLLTAKLNVLNGATCDFATTAIAAADTFLANSPPGGTAGAPDLIFALTQFNEGFAAGCPSNCGN